ncbi:hypothetical protein Drose_05710 [Dactylosporangium roseum]|uniref:Uncharacterized protein n=1 Tax=Dactylosporangium roseum TaxID=47989 RepID=A0ABY5Z6V7_9ACTN|nr:hypothetical protein [Dactylosporangium roseum]UWZ37766.1 hypothetical protein Drose_05710 [Dactylosporangium roseum]
MSASEWGVDPELDPRSFEAAVQWRAVREAENIVYRAEHAPGPMERFTSSLFEQVRQARDEELAE